MHIPDEVPLKAGATPAPNAFAVVLSEAVAAQRLTLDRLQSRLKQAGTPVSAATLSYWQTGRSVPTRRRSLRAIEELERILQVPSGHLVKALPGDYFPTNSPDQLMPNDLATEMLAELGLTLGRHFSGLVDITRTVIGEQRDEVSQHCEQVLRSNEVAWQRVPLVVVQDADQDCVPQVSATTGCRLGRTLTEPRANLLVAELVFPRPLARGEVTHISYDLTWAPSSTPSFRTERILLNRHQTMSIGIGFAGEPPRTATGYWRPTFDADAPAPGEPAGHAHPLTVHDGELLRVVTEAEAGVHGVSWQW